MTRALLWKEWREQRPIVIAGLALAIVMPFAIAAGMASLGRNTDLAMVSATLPLVMWPILTVACGASTIAWEIGDGTLGFLLSRPVSRLRVWLVKLVMAGLALLVIICGSVAAMAIFSLSQESEFFRLLRSEGLLRGGLQIAATLLLLFACAVFFSTFLSRPMTAAVAGLVTALAIGASIFFVWGRLDLMPAFEADWLFVELAAAAVPFLAASLWIFTAGELLSSRGFLGPVLFGATGALGGAVLVVVPLMMAVTRLDPQDAHLSETHLVPGRSALVATAHRDGEKGFSPEVWLIHLDGSGIERLTGRLAGWPAVSPDGRLVAYVSMHGPLGLRAVEPSLRVVNVDGGGARVIVPTLLGLHPYIQTTAWGQIEWSPQGDRIALLYRDSLTVAALDGSSVITRSLAKQSAGMCRLVGWTPDGKELLLLPPAGIRPEFQHLLAYHPESDRTRELFVAPHGVAFGGDRIAADMTTLMVRGDSSEAASGLTLVGVHVDDGTVETLVEHACSGGFDVSADAKTVVYGACEAPDGAQRGQFEIRVLDRMSGAERATPPIDGRLWEVHLSPNAQWVAVLRYGTGPHPLPVVAAGLDGSVTEFEGPWTPLGWTGRSGLVLAEQGEAGYRRIAIGDATSGEVRVVFP